MKSNNPFVLSAFRQLTLCTILFCTASCNSPSAMTPRQLQANAYAAHYGKMQNDVVTLLRRGYTLPQVAAQLHITEAQAAQYARQAYAAGRYETTRHAVLQSELTDLESRPPPVVLQPDSTEIDKLNQRVDYAEQLAIDADNRSRQSQIEAEEKEQQRFFNNPAPKRVDPWHP